MDSKKVKTKATKTSSKKETTDVVTLQNANEIVENNLTNQVVEVASKEVSKKGGKSQALVAKTTKATKVVEEPVKETAVKKTAKSAKESKVIAKESKVFAKEGKVVAKEGKVAAKGDKVVAKKATKAVKKVAKEVAKVVVEDQENGEKVGSKLRYFKLYYNNEIQGRYCGKKPKQAANKAFSSIIKELKKSKENNGGVDVVINFSIKECTRNSKQKEYKYVGKRLLLDKPVTVEISNEDGTVKQIEYKFHNKLQKASKVNV